MTCGLAEGVKIIFGHSGVVVRASELTTQSDRMNYAHARVEVTSEAGRVIRKNTYDREPAIVAIGDMPQDRYIFHRDTLKVGETRGNFRLLDARTVLDAGTISKHYNEVTLEDVVDDIMRSRKDPYGVLTGFEILSEEANDISAKSLRENFVEAIHGADADAADSGWKGAVNTGVEKGLLVAGWAVRLGENRSTFIGFDFDDISPAAALNEVERHYSLVSWVDPNGVLKLGFPETSPVNYHAVSGLDSGPYSMHQYNITSGATRVSLVQVQGQTRLDNGEGGIYPIAEAWVTDENGEVAPGVAVAPEEPRPIWELGDLEAVARNLLIQESMNHRSGTIVFNGMASSMDAELATMSVGDVVLVSDDVTDHCQNESEGGFFLVMSVAHAVSPSRGWLVTCEVAEVPTQDEVDSMAVYFDPAEEEAFRDLRSYTADISEGEWWEPFANGELTIRGFDD